MKRWGERKEIFPSLVGSKGIGEEIGVAYDSEFLCDLRSAFKLGRPGVGAVEDRWVEDCGDVRDGLCRSVGDEALD